MKYLSTLIGIVILLLPGIAKSLTSVNGGIYANTTWTKANSPYVVTDTIVVFPGVTLTIDPGVVVKFMNNKRIEIRQASLMALGTSTDSIVFTSNQALPGTGDWASIYMNGGSMPSRLVYCGFRYAKNAIEYYSTSTLTIQNSDFSFNNNGITTKDVGYSTVFIDSSRFDHNINSGIDFYFSRAAVFINYCNISNNGIGFSGTYVARFSPINKNSIKNTTFRSNDKGIDMLSNTIMDSCRISNNNTGIESGSINVIKNCAIDSNTVFGISVYGDTVENCMINNNGIGVMTAALSVIKNNIIEYNQINIKHTAGYTGSFIIGNIIRNGAVGIDSIRDEFAISKNIIENNAIGIRLLYSRSTITCNKICNNSTYDIKYGAIGNIIIPNNYWCTTNPATVSSHIYDGYTDIHVGLVSVTPMDTLLCYSSSLGIPAAVNTAINLYPNPTQHYLLIDLPFVTTGQTIRIFDLLGRQQYSETSASRHNKIDVSGLSSGIYIIQIGDHGRITRQKFVKE